VSDKIDALFSSIAGKDLPGAAVVVLANGEVIHSRAYGLANVELGVANTTRTKFRLASVTKSFTSLAVLQLVEQGRLRLEDPLSPYVPDFVGGDKITIHHLLSHTAGLPDFMSFDEAKRLPRDSAPGERLNYSNIGYIALGRVIAKVTGKTYETYLREAIWSPLGMNETGVDHRQPIEKGRAAGYVIGPDGGLLNADYTDSLGDPEAGGLYSTAEDMTLWVKALLAGRIVSAATLAKATTPVRLAGGREGVYGYGFMLAPFRGLKEVGHGGDISGFNTYVAIYPDEDLAVIVLSNLGMQPPGPLPTAGDLAHRIVTILVGDRLGPEWPAVVAVPPPVLDRYTGRYRLEAPPTVTGIMGDTIEVSREAEHLFAAGKLGRAEIFAQSETTFYARMGSLTISFLPGGEAVLGLMGLREFRLLRLL
jgi:CubicO group peptidase (beta-lactamase class C family)